MDTQKYFVDNLEDVKLYVLNQGDKFHPLSDQLWDRFLEAEADDADSAEQAEALLASVVKIIADYVAAPTHRPYEYHVDRMLTMLQQVEDKD